MIAAMLLPVVLAFFSRRMVVLVSCISGAVIVFLTFMVPSYAAVILVAAVYLASVIVALTGIVSRRRAPAPRADFAQLRRDVDNLLAAENRRFLSGLRGSTEAASGDPSAKTN